MTDTLKPTCDRKTRFWTSQKNTFGLLPGLEGTCPGATTGADGCWYKAPGRKTATCYVSKLMIAYRNIHGNLAHNTTTLMQRSPIYMAEILNAEFERFRTAEERHAKRTGDGPHLYYRLHWAGDIFSPEYARAIAIAVKTNSDIKFWIYTRSFFAVPMLVDIPNLIVYLSLDPVNVQQGMLVYATHKDTAAHNLQICYMSGEDNFDETKPRTLEILDGRNQVRIMLNAPVQEIAWASDICLRACPVDAGRLNLEGGCSKCRKCVRDDHQPVWFKS